MQLRLGFSASVAVAVATAVAACVGDDPPPSGDPADASTVDSPGVADTGTDANVADVAGDAGPRCDPTRPFSKVEEVSELNGVGAGNSVAHLTRDGLTVYFARVSTTSQFDIYVAKRATRDGTFDAPVQVGLSRPSTELDSYPFITPDGSALFFVRSSGGTLGDRNILRAPASSGGFATADSVIGLSTAEAEERAPWLASDGAMWIDTRTPDSGVPKRIGYALATGVASFGTLSMVDLATPPTAADSDPVLSADGKRLYFASTRQPTVGAADIFVATRDATGAAFGMPVPLPAVNADLDEAPSWISEDDCELWYSSARTGGFRIFRVFRE